MAALAPQSAAAPRSAAAPAKEEDPKDQDKKRLYVRWEVTDESLKAAFEKFGKIAETRVVRGPRLRAFGFLTFETEEAAAKAKAEMENKAIPAGPLEIQYASAAGAQRAREKKERKPRLPAVGADGKTAPAGADGKTEAKRTRAPRQPKAAGGAAPAAGVTGEAGAPKPEGKRGARKPRRGRGRGAAAAAGGAAGTGAGAANADGKRDSKRDDPNWGKVVRLVPDPIRTPIAGDAQITELNAGARAYKVGRTDAKQIASLVLNADPNKGPFNCSFNLGAFALKLLEVKVSSRDGSQPTAAGAPGDGIRDVRVGCRVVHPDSNRSREVYLRVKGQESKHKFLELRLPNPKDASGKEQELSAEVESFFVTIDSIQLDVKTGLWKKIMLSLMSMMVPRVAPPRAAAATDSKVAVK